VEPNLNSDKRKSTQEMAIELESKREEMKRVDYKIMSRKEESRRMREEG
jgi:hypothetical protein